MATVSAILIPAQKQAVKIAALAASTSSAEQDLGFNEIFAINADQDITIRFGQTGAVTNASATDFRIPANVIAVYDIGRGWPAFKVFNLSASTAVNVYYQFLAKG